MTQQQIQSLREKFFKECVDTRTEKGKMICVKKVNMAPHGLFEWFIKELQERNSDVASERLSEAVDDFVPNVPSPDVKSVASHSSTAPTQIEQDDEEPSTGWILKESKEIFENAEFLSSFFSKIEEWQKERIKILIGHGIISGYYKMMNKKQNVHESVATTAPTELPNPDTNITPN